MVIAEISIFPIDKGISLSKYVARVIKRLQEMNNISISLNPMGTVIEGKWEDILKAVDISFKELEKDCDRIYMTLKVDYKKGRERGIEKKVESVKSKLENINLLQDKN